jgi:hypothetical protein
LTNRVISGLPADQRKGYLLRPRSFLRLEAMLDAILEADGITPEMLAAQRAKAELLERLLRATSSDTRQVIARENNDLIDYQFFQLLSLNIELAQREGQAESAQQLLGLRQQLLQWTTVGQEVSDRDEAIRSLGERVTREGLLEKVVEAALAGEPAKVETMVVVARSAIEYIFYQQLTGRIEAAEAAGRSGEADTLRELRKTILDLTAEIDAEVEAMTQEAGRSLESLLESDDPQAALHANPSLVDEYLLSALATSMRAAERSGQTERAQKLRKLNEAIVELIQENQPPEVQLVNRLLAAEFPGGTEALLKENRHLVSTQLLELMDSLGIDLAEGEQNELTRQLRQIREQAAALLPESA